MAYQKSWIQNPKVGSYGGTLRWDLEWDPTVGPWSKALAWDHNKGKCGETLRSDTVVVP